MIKRLTFRNPYEKNRPLYRQNTLPDLVEQDQQQHHLCTLKGGPTNDQR